MLARSLLRRLFQAFPSAPTIEAAPGQMMAGRHVPRLSAGRAGGTALPSGSSEESGTPAVVFKRREQLPIEIEEDEIPVEALKRAELQKRATEFIKEKPEQATQIIRSWIVEETYEPSGR